MNISLNSSDLEFSFNAVVSLFSDEVLRYSGAGGWEQGGPGEGGGGERGGGHTEGVGLYLPR